MKEKESRSNSQPAVHPYRQTTGWTVTRSSTVSALQKQPKNEKVEGPARVIQLLYF